jgi:hypothetical protein
MVLLLHASYFSKVAAPKTSWHQAPKRGYAIGSASRLSQKNKGGLSGRHFVGKILRKWVCSLCGTGSLSRPAVPNV